tara:strand:+ start:658 stop:870 length:213 start_codon:yes stop_codon:yes gene_type:complete
VASGRIDAGQKISVARRFCDIKTTTSAERNETHFATHTTMRKITGANVRSLRGGLPIVSHVKKNALQMRQ